MKYRGFDAFDSPAYKMHPNPCGRMIDPHAERLALEEIQYLDIALGGMDGWLQLVHAKCVFLG